MATFVEVRSGDGKRRHGWIEVPIEQRQLADCRVWWFDVGRGTVRLEVMAVWHPVDDRQWLAFNGGEMSLDALRLIPGFVERRYLAGETNGKVEKGTEGPQGAEAGQAGLAEGVG